jgi:hypothetical protein
MRFFVQSTIAPEPRTQNVKVISIALAAVFVMLAVAQLYSYENFPDVLASLWLPGGRPMATVLAALLVVGEVLAVPFLLSMRLSPAMRIMSMVAGWLVIAVWLKITILINITTNATTNGGILGATIPVSPGWWTVGLFIALGALIAWVSWGMWPLPNRFKER